MPIYEYRCPEGHTFELFQRMTDPAPDACDVCGATPVTKVLYPAAIHFKGSGFYSTDYGRGSRKRDGKDGDAASDGKSESGKADEKKSEAKVEKKAAEA
jgi:putative FmdB family regulatory protein